jgi:energy-coupling factor transport system permease protein
LKGLHPLSLILAALWFSTAAIFVPGLGWLLAALGLSLLFRGWLAGFEWRLWWRQFVKLLPLFAAILVIQALFVKRGDLIWGRGWYSIHDVALATGAAFSLRLLILFFSAQLLLKLAYEDFDLAFHALRLPEELGFMVFYTIHVIPAAGEKFRKSLQLLRLRGLDPGKLPWKDKLSFYKHASLAVLGDILTRSGIQATALDLRGFRSSGPRSWLNHRKYAWPDLLLALAMALMTLLYLVFK